jgi:rhodanese-related sulfurtransferase
MSRTSFLFLLVSLLALPSIPAQEKVKHVNADQASKLVQEGKVTVVDVRTADEFREGHIKGAKNIDFNSTNFAKKAAEIDKAKPVLVHCQAGGRSTRSLPTLEKLGLEIYHLDGGINAWEEAGKPLEK